MLLACSINCGPTFKDFEITNSEGSNPFQWSATWQWTYLEKQSRTNKDESGTDDELSHQQCRTKKRLASKQSSLRQMKAEENTVTTSIGAHRIATKAQKTGDGGILWHSLVLDSHIQKLRPEVLAFSLNRTGKRNSQHYSGIGLFVSYQTSTGFRRHECRLLLVKPEAIDPGHRSTPGKYSNPLERKVKDAYSTPFNQGRDIDNNDSSLMGNHEFIQSDRPFSECANQNRP